MNRVQRGGETLPYSEILRTAGQYADRAGLCEVRIIETDEGLILQGRLVSGAHAGERETYQITTDDIDSLRRDAKARRGRRM